MSPTRNASMAGGIAGIIGWAVFAVAFAIAPTPPTLGASAAEITRYYGEHHTATLIAAFLFATTAPLLAVWAGALAPRLRTAEGETAWLYLTFITGVAVTLAVDVCASFMWMALSGRGWSLGDAAAQTLSDIANCGFIFTGFGSVVFIAAAAVVMIRTAEISRILGQLGLLVAVCKSFVCSRRFSPTASWLAAARSRSQASHCWAYGCLRFPLP
jgi:hypothetical protein